MADPITYWTLGLSCCNERWEEAYNRFETPEEEIAKFQKRLVEHGAMHWDKSARVVDLFCGSGRNLTCLANLGFLELHGVDLSPRLLGQYVGPAKLYVGDATDLKFDDDWADIVIVQGGLHHLPRIPDDLEKCLIEIRRILKPGGMVVIVEPWLTPMLHFVHWCCRRRILRAAWLRLDALATMIEEEIDTYSAWLASSGTILKLLDENFSCEVLRIAKGKVSFRGHAIETPGDVK